MNPFEEARIIETRRQFLARGKNVLGMAALSSLLGESLFQQAVSAAESQAMPHLPH
ncbi:MAG: hypothetical protein JOZ57_13080, partial [Abitibacteriaceae bacterium]|nr:hypothetical protein [Abditibacteriaceae bacterium]